MGALAIDERKYGCLLARVLPRVHARELPEFFGIAADVFI